MVKAVNKSPSLRAIRFTMPTGGVVGNRFHDEPGHE